MTAPPVVAVAYSGGRDSTALLHATCAAAAPLGVQVVALHVHHGLSAQAGAWEAHCRATCRRWARRGAGLAFLSTHLQGAPARGESVEAWARAGRSAALHRMANEAGATLLLLAHHRRDQAETFILQALRGAGAAGLAAMPRRIERAGLVWARPWLDTPREHVEAYVRRHRLAFIEDESNADPRFARNRLRLQTWPALVAAFPQAEAALADAAARLQDAAACAEALAAIDLAACAPEADALEVAAWQALPAPRAANALRAWLRSATGRAPSANLTHRLLDELPRMRSACWPLDGIELRLHRGLLRAAVSATPAEPESAPPARRESSLSIRGAGFHALPGWGGRLEAVAVAREGVPLAWLGTLQLAERRGGERFQPAIGRPPRSLKKQFQAAGLAAWERSGPLVYSGGQLVFVPGLGIDARVIALPGQPQFTLRWHPGLFPAG